MKDKFVLQNDSSGMIHQLRRDGRTYCGLKNDENFSRRKLSKALKHPKARHCGARGKCMVHQ